MRAAVLTGLPRSGTTLACELLNQVPDTVALDEPMDWWSFTGGDHPGQGVSRAGGVEVIHSDAPTYSSRVTGYPNADDVCDRVERFFDATRESIVTRGVAVSKHVGGKVTGQKVSDRFADSRVRVGLAERGEIAFDKPLSPEFLLVIKHVAGFTALLEPLLARFPVYAVVRNPLSILSSWQTVRMPIRDGHAVFGEAFDPNLGRQLASIDDRIERQLHLLGWFFGRFHDLLDPGAIVRYEDVVAAGGRSLACITGAAAGLHASLSNRNGRRGVHDQAMTRELGARLLATDGPWWDFYPRQSVQELLDEQG